MDLFKIATYIAAGNSESAPVPSSMNKIAAGPQSFYVDWEGRGYTFDRFKKDFHIMKAALGEGPIFTGSSEDHDVGQFFSNSETLTNTRWLCGGEQQVDPGEFDGEEIYWSKYDTWEQLFEDMPILDSYDETFADL